MRRHTQNDLSILLKHAFMSGFAAGDSPCAKRDAWIGYSPPERQLDRVEKALDKARHEKPKGNK